MAPLIALITATVGIVIFMNAFATSTLSTSFLGGALLVAAAAQIVFAFVSKRAGSFVSKFVVAVSYAAAGLALLTATGAARTTVGAMLIVAAMIETVMSNEVPDVIGRECYLFSAAWCALTGLIVLAVVSNGSTWLVAAGAGVAVTLSGVSRIVIAATADDTPGETEEALEAKLELEHISGLGATLLDARDRFRSVHTRPLDRAGDKLVRGQLNLTTPIHPSETRS